MKLLNAILISSLGLVGLPALAHGGEQPSRSHGYESAPPPPPDMWNRGGDAHRHRSGGEIDDTERMLHRGIRSGALTPKEVHKLRHMQDRLREAKRQARADGFISWKEQRRIERLERKLERQLERDLNDHQRVRAETDDHHWHTRVVIR